MKKIYSILATAALLSLSGCFNDVETGSPADGISLNLNVTKAADDGDAEFNENKIQTVHYYFFDKAGTFVYDNTQTINKTGEADISLSGISSANFNSIFSGRTELDVLVVANAVTPDGTSTTTIDGIKATAVTLPGFGKQESFVMVGEGTLTKTGATTAATSEISLKRVASKITLHLIVPDTYVDGADKEWLPLLDAAQIDFNNLGRNVLVNGEDAPSPVLGNAARKSTSGDFNLNDAIDETVTPNIYLGQDLSLNVPVYSYPREWSNGDEDTPYIFVTLPWKMSDETMTADTYYKILLPGTSLESNDWYDITAKLGGLGSLVKEGTTTVENLRINVSKDWKDAIGEGRYNTDADMAMPRVIAVEQNALTMYNQNSIEIPFVSSHDCNIIDATTSEINSKGLPANQDSGAGTVSSISIDNVDRVIRFTHNLTNMPATGTTYDYKEYIHTYKLVHKTDASMYEYITIVQKPALCVSTETFSTGSPDNAKTKIFIDGAKLPNTGVNNDSNTYRVLGTSRTSGVLTRITASVLPTEGIISAYVLGEVRSKTNSIGTAPFITGNSINTRYSTTATEKFINTNTGTTDSPRRLTYYYEARQNAADVISPEFIIASSLPGVYGHLMNYNQARLRCATFQEEGYPAGRWRLPTYAEMRFIFKLQMDGKIGEVFDAGAPDSIANYDNYQGKHYCPYACADGNFYCANNAKTDIELPALQAGKTIRTGSVRCVYDSWYWDQLPAYEETTGTNQQRYENSRRLPDSQWTTFTWGDKQISW